MSHTGNLGYACVHVVQKRTWGALIGAGALNRADTVCRLTSDHNCKSPKIWETKYIAVIALQFEQICHLVKKCKSDSKLSPNLKC